MFAPLDRTDTSHDRRREGWADYFEAHNIQYAFFSAANGIALQEERARREAMLADEEEEGSSSEEYESDEDESEDDVDPLAAIVEDLSVVPGMKIPKSGNKLNAPGPSQGKANVAERRPNADGQMPGEEDESEEEDSDDDEEAVVDGELVRKMRRGVGISTAGSGESDRTRILSVLELEELFLKQAPEGEFALQLWSSSMY